MAAVERAGLARQPAGRRRVRRGGRRARWAAGPRASDPSLPGRAQRPRGSWSPDGPSGDEARAIGERLVDDDLDGARRRLPALVGRDPSRSTPRGWPGRSWSRWPRTPSTPWWRRPAGRRLGGAAGAGFYRAVNTLDAMVGHRNERYQRFGWAAARLDDVANWVPARADRRCWWPPSARTGPGRCRRPSPHPPAHPSPNAGVAEAAFAAALGLRLGGDTVYAGRVDPRPAFGTGRPPEPADIDAAVRLSRDVTLALAALLATPAVLGRLRSGTHRAREGVVKARAGTWRPARPVFRRPGHTAGMWPRSRRRSGATRPRSSTCRPASIPMRPTWPRLAQSELDSLSRYPDPGAGTEAMAAALGVRPPTGCCSPTAAPRPSPWWRRSRAGRRWRRRSSRSMPGISPRWSTRRRIREPRGSVRIPTTRLGGSPTPADDAAVWDEAFYPLATGVWSRGDVAAGRAAVGHRLAHQGVRLPGPAGRLRARRPGRHRPAGPAPAPVGAQRPGRRPRPRAARPRPICRRGPAANARRRSGTRARPFPAVEPSDANFVLVRVAEGRPPPGPTLPGGASWCGTARASGSRARPHRRARRGRPRPPGRGLGGMTVTAAGCGGRSWCAARRATRARARS